MQVHFFYYISLTIDDYKCTFRVLQGSSKVFLLQSFVYKAIRAYMSVWVVKNISLCMGIVLLFIGRTSHTTLYVIKIMA